MDFAVEHAGSFGIGTPSNRALRHGRFGHVLLALSQASDFREIQSPISEADWKPPICSLRPSGQVSSMYHALPSFSSRGTMVGFAGLIIPPLRA